MKKILLIVSILFLPLISYAAYDDVLLSTGSEITVSGGTLTGDNGATLESLDVGADNFTVVMPAGSSFNFASANKKTITVTGGLGSVAVTSNCGASSATYTFSNPSTGTTLSLIVEVGSATCTGGLSGALFVASNSCSSDSIATCTRSGTSLGNLSIGCDCIVSQPGANCVTSGVPPLGKTCCAGYFPESRSGVCLLNGTNPYGLGQPTPVPGSPGDKAITCGSNGINTAIGCLPARCTWTSRIAPSPQAMVRQSSSTLPGTPRPSALVERSALMRTPPSSNQAPGNGDRPRIWLCTWCAGMAQAMRVSSFAILAA